MEPRHWIEILSSASRLRICLTAVSLLLPLMTFDKAHAQDCEGMEIHAEHLSNSAIQEVCRATLKARQFLAACGIRPLQTLSARVEKQISLPSGLPAFAYYDVPQRMVIIRDQAHFKAQIPVGSAFDRLPESELYNSLIAHEIAHAISFQHLTGSTPSRVGLEYIAAVTQVSCMHDSTRRLLLAAFPRHDRVELDSLNIFSLHAAPQWFTANAYRHFSETPDGCRLLRDILSGDLVFSDSLD